MEFVKKRIEVVAAVIFRRDPQAQPEVLAFQRKAHDVGGGAWEFPGGKLEAQETHAQALVREIHEELGVSGQVLEFAAESDFETPDYILHLTAYFFELEAWSFVLTDHQALVWVNELQAQSLPWSQPDIPLVGEVFRQLKVQAKK